MPTPPSQPTTIVTRRSSIVAEDGGRPPLPAVRIAASGAVKAISMTLPLAAIQASRGEISRSTTTIACGIQTLQAIGSVQLAVKRAQPVS
jgi:hypothetical protein